MKKKLYEKRVVITCGILLLGVVFTLISMTLKNSYAYYGTSNELEIMKTTIGNFAGDGEIVKNGPIEKSTDVNVIFYAQTPTTKNRYKETKIIPVTNYQINEELSNCYVSDGTSKYTIDEDGTIDIDITESKPNQIVCRMYYDYVNENNLDVIVYAYMQDINGTKSYNNNKYKLVNNIPDNSTLDGFTCNNKSVSTNITYVDNNIVIDSSGPNICQVYFRKNS